MKNYDYTAYRTSDLGLAAALVTAGFSIADIEKTTYGKASFVFSRSDNLDETVNRYWSDDLVVNPKNYFDVIKHLKTRIYSEA